MNIFDFFFPPARQQPSRGINRQPIAEVHGSNKTAGSTLAHSDVKGQLGISTRFGGRGGNASGGHGGRR